MPYVLLQSALSIDIIEALEQLAQGARDGEVMGFAYMVMLRHRKFFVDALGQARRDPHLTRGLLRALDDEMIDLIRAEHIDPTKL